MHHIEADLFMAIWGLLEGTNMLPALLKRPHYPCLIIPQHTTGVPCLQVPVPAPTVSPCKAIDPQCVDCAKGVCTACNIIFTLDDATKKCGEPPLRLMCRPCSSQLDAEVYPAGCICRC